MMKTAYSNVKRYVLIGLAFCSMLATSTFAVRALADDEGTVDAYECTSLGMVGASVRVDKTYGGLRFAAKFKKSEADAVPTGYSLQYGILAIPASLSTDELTIDNATDDIMNLTIDTPATTTDNGVNYYEIRGVISNIPVENYGTEVLGRGYVSVVNSEGTVVKTFYTETLSRNIAYVGYKAQLEDSSLTESLKNYYNEKTFSTIAWDETLVKCDYDYAYAGQVINVTPVDADRVEEIKINNGEVNFNAETNTFVMPADDVTITVVKKVVDLSKDLSTQFNAWEVNGGNGTITLGERFTTEDGETKTALKFTSDNGGVYADANLPGDYAHLYNVSLDPELITQAKAEGYESITFTVAAPYAEVATGSNITTRVHWHNYSGTGRVSGISGWIGEKRGANTCWTTVAVSLDELTNGTLAITAGGATLYVTEVYLNKPVDLTADLSTDLRAWASNDSASTLAVEDFTTTDGETKTALKWTSNNKSMSWGDTAGEWVKMYTLYIDQELITQAKKEGYASITFTITGAGRLAYFNYSGSGYVNGYQGTNLLGRYNSNNGNDQWHTYEVALSSLTNGTLSLAGTTSELYVTEVYFNKGVDLTADLSTDLRAWASNDSASTLAVEDFTTTDGETKKALKWTSNNLGGGVWDYTADKAGSFQKMYTLYINQELIARAIEEGYTSITFTMTGAGRLKYFNYSGSGYVDGYAGSNLLGGYNSALGNAEWKTFTVALSSLTNGTLSLATHTPVLYVTEVYFTK